MLEHSHPHVEEHSRLSTLIRDSVIGLADGLTVPFALAAGLSGATNATDLIVTAGVAEIAAGAIAMGLGGYMAARTEADRYRSELQREWQEVKEVPEIEAKEVTDILEDYGLPHAEALMVTTALRQNPVRWVEFMMRFELGLEKPNPKDLIRTPLTIGVAYILGGFIPLLPYILYTTATDALPISIIMTLCALTLFGALKGHFTGIPKLKAALQTTAIGGLAAAVAYGVARLIM